MKQGKLEEGKDHKKRGKRRSRLPKQVVIGFFCALFIVAGILSAVCAYFWHLRSVTDASDVIVDFQNDTISITWDPAKMDACRLFRYDEKTEEYVFCGQYQNEIIMDAGEDGEEVKLRLQAVRYMNPFGHRVELLGRSRELTINPMEKIKLYSYAIPEDKIIFILWQEEEGSTYEVYRFDDVGGSARYFETGNNIIMFDFENDLALPERGDSVQVAVRVVHREEDYIAYGPISESVMISRNDLLENNLSLCWEQVEERQYVLSWQEGHGDWYEVQQWSEEEKRWVSKCTLDWAQEMTYQTDHLPSNAQVRFRVITYDTVAERDREEFRAEPSEVTIHTGMSTLYCTIWPIVPLKIMDKPQGGEILGEVPAGQALCVLEENGSCFKIAYKNDIGYIDSRFCMINLPEYLGDLCEYDITNSISSIFRIHEYDIPEITGSVVQGYENVCLGNGDFLVPYLYPCTVKLYQAALNAAADGYCLRIYDAFRPNEATRYLYDTVEALLNDPIMEEGDERDETEQTPESGDASGTAQTDVAQGKEQTTDAGQAIDGERTPDGGQTTDGEHTPDGEQTADIEGAPDGEQTIDTEPENDESGWEMYDTYGSIMTDDGRYRLRSFLAPTVSAHNRGIALDLVLIDADTKENLPMQTEIHDLSWYSVTGQNNENARLLAQYMKGAGYNDLVTEWWHFQDDDTRNQIGLNSYLTEGVSIEGWKRDDTGWRYRLGDGSFYQDTTVMIDGQKCVFDEEGYCIREGLDE